MKALSIRQPWAWLVAGGHKDVGRLGFFDLPSAVEAELERRAAA